MNEVQYDKKDQLEKIQGQLLEGEVLLAVFDLKGGGTGFIGITSWRVIFMDKSFKWAARKKTALVSVPYKAITAVASEDSGGLVFKSSTLTVISAGGQWELEFRSNEKAHWAYQQIIRRVLSAGSSQ